MRTYIKLITKYYFGNKELINNFTLRSLQVLGKQGINFLIFILCAKLLSLYDFGVYNYILAIVFFLTMFADFGISTATSRYVAEYNLKSKNKLKAVLFNAGLLIFTITILITIVVLTLGDVYLKDKYFYVLWVIPLIFLAPMTALYDGIYRGLKDFKRLTLISVSVGLISIPVIYLLVKYYGLLGALFSQNIFYTTLLGALAIGYKNYSFTLHKEVIKEIGIYSFMYGVALFGNYLFIRFGILILGHFGYIKELGMYELLNKIFVILILPFTLLGQVVAPNFTELAVTQQYDIIFLKTKKYTVYFFILGVFVGGIAYVSMPYFIQMFLPSYYNELFFQIFPYTVIIYVMQVWAATVDAGIIVPAGFASLMAKLYLVLGVLGSLLSYLWALRYGYMGVIYSFTTLSFIMVILLRLLFIYKLKSRVKVYS